MSQMKEIGVAVLGFGTVGAGVVETLRKNGGLLGERLGLRLVLRGVADLDVKTDRGVAIDPALLTTDGAALVARPDVDVVVELIGGTGAAKAFILQALQLGKPVEDGRPSAQPEILGKPMDDDKPKQQASLAKALNDLLFGAGGPAAEKYKNSPLADQTK